MAGKAEVTGVVVSDKMEKSVVVAVERQVRDRAVRQDAAAHVEVRRAQRGERRQGGRPRRDRREPAAQPPQAVGRDARRREGQGDLKEPP